MSLNGWNTEKVLTLADSPATAYEGKLLSIPAKWTALGSDEYTAWGEYQGSGSSPYQVMVDLMKLQNGEVSLRCTCPSRKHPCKHALGLLFIVVEKPQALTAGQAPDYVKNWLDKQALRARDKQDKKKTARKPERKPEEVSKSYLERKRKILAGLQELEPWLYNLIHHGLVDPQLKHYEFWDGRAARMVDAQAPGIARWLREMGSIVASGSGDWLETMLRQLGLLHLLVEGFKNFDKLPPGIQADMRTVAGWHLKKDELSNQQPIRDEWVVTGYRTAQEEKRLRSQRIWLRGKQAGQDALILEFVFGDQPFETQLTPGDCIDAEMIFFPSNYPLRAFIQIIHSKSTTAHLISGSSLPDSLEIYRRAIVRNPWLEEFPMLLGDVIPTRYDGKWVLRDVEGGYMPLSPKFEHRFALMALSGNTPITVAGEWDGAQFLPSSVIADGRFIDLNLVDETFGSRKAGRN